MNTWNAFQIALSNGAYGGKDVRFMTGNGQVEGQLRRAHRSDRPGHTMLLVTVLDDSDWHTVPDETLVEVL